MKTVNVVAAIIKRDNRILGTQRGYGDFAGGWEFPGGKIEPGETPEEAIQREVREELGVAIVVDRLVTVVDYDYETFHLHMYCFLCHMVSGQLELHEHRAARWLDVTTVDSVDWLPADIEVIKMIKDEGVL